MPRFQNVQEQDEPLVVSFAFLLFIISFNSLLVSVVSGVAFCSSTSGSCSPPGLLASIWIPSLSNEAELSSQNPYIKKRSQVYVIFLSYSRLRVPNSLAQAASN